MTSKSSCAEELGVEGRERKGKGNGGGKREEQREKGGGKEGEDRRREGGKEKQTRRGQPCFLVGLGAHFPAG